MNKVIKFILFLFPWFISSIFISDISFYNTINLPVQISPLIFTIVWTICYILVTISVLKVVNSNKNSNNYFKILAINYLLNQLFTLVLFGVQDLLLSFIVTLLIFLTSINLFIETRKTNIVASNYLIYYMILSFFGTILMLSIYIIN